MALPKAEQHACWVGNAVGQTGKAPLMSCYTQKVPFEAGFLSYK